MKIQKEPMGVYQTNCYIVTVDQKDFIIDPGVDALEWIKSHTTHPVAILNTHGHFDHVWSNHAVKEHFKIPIYCPHGDEILLESDPFNQGTPPSHPDFIVEGDKVLDIAGVEVGFMHFPGHTPGCSMIQIGEAIFSGDFIFENSIGRWDFPLSSAQDMRQSLKRFLALDFDATLYPGHGHTTTIKAEQKHTPFWLQQVY